MNQVPFPRRSIDGCDFLGPSEIACVKRRWLQWRISRHGLSFLQLIPPAHRIGLNVWRWYLYSNSLHARMIMLAWWLKYSVSDRKLLNSNLPLLVTLAEQRETNTFAQQSWPHLSTTNATKPSDTRLNKQKPSHTNDATNKAITHE
ncbi:hypothetical protein TNCV_1122901 [Trichonephila clavipes]|uniref:Uncharacterized protein n=1 Tax=Trichonephila clavipes TaxID=2585209 RepID=A0A8X6SKI0_TRICX|nr:hypothetical protein TNCV_1122901 [Trichonephila clavipes]